MVGSEIAKNEITAKPSAAKAQLINDSKKPIFIAYIVAVRVIYNGVGSNFS